MSLLLQCEHFTTKNVEVNGVSKVILGRRSFTHLLCTAGCGKLQHGDEELSFTKGTSIFIPAGIHSITLPGNVSLIVTSA